MAQQPGLVFNVEMNILDSDGYYYPVYPKTQGSLVEGVVASATSATSATTATTLATARTIQTNLGSTSSASFNGSTNVTPGVTGTLPISNGGTGGTTASAAMYNLIYPLSSRTASSVNSYASSTYLGAYYGSTGYKIPISNLLTYFQNNLSGSGVKVISGTRVGTDTETFSISWGTSSDRALAFGYSSKTGGTWGTGYIDPYPMYTPNSSTFSSASFYSNNEVTHGFFSGISWSTQGCEFAYTRNGYAAPGICRCINSSGTFNISVTTGTNDTTVIWNINDSTVTYEWFILYI